MTPNKRILDAQISHMISTERYKTSVERDIIKILDEGSPELQAMLIAGLIDIKEGKITKLAKAIGRERAKLFDAAYKRFVSEIGDFVDYEADYQKRIIQGAFSVQIELSKPRRTVLKKAVIEEAFRGRILKDWFEGMKRADADRIADAIRIGIADGLTTDQIVRNIAGTKSKRYADGITNISRNDAKTITRTAIAHASDVAAQSLWEANQDILAGVKWVSTLDTRTSPICRERDGKIYKVDKAPPIPAHWNCRSRKVAYLKNQPKGLRASQAGQIPDDISYGQWLKKQPIEIQEEVLGVRKARLFRNGGLTIDRFQDKTGKLYTLDELRVRDSEAWNKVFG